MQEVSEAPLSFGVLGALAVYRDGAPVPLPGGRRRALLAALLARANQPVPGDALIEAAWGDALPTDPRAALQTALSRLRGTVGAGTLRAEPAGYVLATDAVDAVRFEALRTRAADAPAGQAATLLDAGLGLWRGRAYAEFADRDFATAEAVRLDELRLRTVEDRAQLALELGTADDAISALEALIAEHPLRERARGLLMTALYQAGRPTDALERYRDCRTLLSDELGLDPSPALRELEVRILGHDLAAAGPATRPRQRAPAPPTWLISGTAFVGRDDETAALLDAFAAHRLVTITGPGGVGKTRLAAESLPAVGDQLGLPTSVVELAPVAGGQVDTAVAAALGVGAGAGSPRQAVLEYLSISAAVLVLDNCEHVLDEVRTLVETLLRRCSGVRILATSRHRLGPAAEQLLPLEPLPAPDRDVVPGRVELTAAVRLFTDRMRRVRPSFALTPDVLPAVAEICGRLDGLPLALELAATRAATLGLGPVRDRLDRSLDMLGEPGRDRHQTLRAMLDWSYQLLAPEQRRLLAALSVFDGGFDLDAAEAVGDGEDGEPVAVGLARLVEASLVALHEEAGTTRYRLLVIVRAFAAERLAEAGREHETRLRHVHWVHCLAETAAHDATGPGTAAALARLRRYRTGLTTAIRWALQSGHAELAGRITGSLGLCPHLRLDAELFDLMREVAHDRALRRTPAAALALAAGAVAAVEQGELEIGEAEATEALALAAEPPERYLALLALGVSNLYRGRQDESMAWWRELLTVEGLPLAYRADAHGSLALLAGYRGDLEAARECATRAWAAAEDARAGVARAFAGYATGEVILLTDREGAVPVLREAAADADRVGAAHVGAVCRIALLSALTRLGRHPEAVDLAGPLLHDELRTGSWPQLWTTLRIVAELLVSLDRHETAALLLAAAHAARSAPAIKGDDVDRYRRIEERIAEQVRPPALDRIATLARALPRAQIVDRALATIGDPGASEVPAMVVAGPSPR